MADEGPGHGPPPPYVRYRIETRILDEKGAVVDEFEDTQELWLEPPNIAVRRTREMPDGTSVIYEDRGTVDQTLRITGTDGFGGEWSGKAMPDRGVFHTEGRGDSVDFHMTSWTIEMHKEEACLRVLDVKEPVAFLTPDTLAPGRYYVNTKDHVTEARPEAPDEIKRPI